VQQGSSTWTIRAGSAWWYESAGQINASLPFGLAPGYANVWVTNAAGVASNNYWIYLYSRCGNGVVDAGEACDGGACCSSTCQLLGAGTLCRAANGSCDAAETCTGGSPFCPGDAWLPNGSWCPSGTCQNGACTATNPAPQISAIVDGVTYSYTIYRTSVLTLFGSNFSTWGNTVWIQQGWTWAVGYGTPWWYESPGQINASLPSGIGQGWATVYVTNASGQASNTYWIYVN
jgi:hypothetical protein